MTRDFAYRNILVDEIHSSDLQAELAASPGDPWEAYAISVGREGMSSNDDPNWAEPNGASMLINLSAFRFGIEWGGGADWYDVPTRDTQHYLDLAGACIDRWLNDPESLSQ